METFIVWLGDRMFQWLSMFNRVSFQIGSVTVGFVDLLIGALLICLVISVFWKGARTN